MTHEGTLNKKQLPEGKTFSVGKSAKKKQSEGVRFY